mmetsp:Transcript_101093/g.285003  ORF Transcript_101093/g.285003 Transcript_101093/m.285003 type:complete len:427 (+) Transcript_101093:127-1407(+)
MQIQSFMWCHLFRAAFLHASGHVNLLLGPRCQWLCLTHPKLWLCCHMFHLLHCAVGSVYLFPFVKRSVGCAHFVSGIRHPSLRLLKSANDNAFPFFGFPRRLLRLLNKRVGHEYLLQCHRIPLLQRGVRRVNLKLCLRHRLFCILLFAACEVPKLLGLQCRTLGCLTFVVGYGRPLHPCFLNRGVRRTHILFCLQRRLLRFLLCIGLFCFQLRIVFLRPPLGGFFPPHDLIRLICSTVLGRLPVRLRRLLSYFNFNNVQPHQVLHDVPCLFFFAVSRPSSVIINRRLGHPLLACLMSSVFLDQPLACLLLHLGSILFAERLLPCASLCITPFFVNFLLHHHLMTLLLFCPTYSVVLERLLIRLFNCKHTHRLLGLQVRLLFGLLRAFLLVSSPRLFFSQLRINLLWHTLHFLCRRRPNLLCFHLSV